MKIELNETRRWWIVMALVAGLVLYGRSVRQDNAERRRAHREQEAAKLPRVSPLLYPPDGGG